MADDCTVAVSVKTPLVLGAVQVKVAVELVPSGWGGAPWRAS